MDQDTVTFSKCCQGSSVKVKASVPSREHLGLRSFSSQSKSCQASPGLSSSLSIRKRQKWSCSLTKENLIHFVVEGEICLSSVRAVKLSRGSHYMS